VEPNREEYVRQVLGAYRQTPGTTGSVRREDRLLATQLHQRQVPLRVVENALVLAAARRLLRPAHALPLGTIRSLAYFLPVIDEVLDLQSAQITSNTSAAKSRAFVPPPQTHRRALDAVDSHGAATPSAWHDNAAPSRSAAARLRRG
jgi:hypothetical protein